MRRRKLVVVCVWTAGVAALVYGVLSFLCWIDISRCETTQRQLFGFKGMVSIWSGVHGKLPGPRLEDAVKAVDIFRRERGEEGLDQLCPWIVRNRDAWGHPFVYELKDGGRKMIMRSLGSNGVDDNGTKDDIQVELSL